LRVFRRNFTGSKLACFCADDPFTFRHGDESAAPYFDENDLPFRTHAVEGLRTDVDYAGGHPD
jgi:hypothetical protein